MLVFTLSESRGETEASELGAKMVTLLISLWMNHDLLISFKILLLLHAILSKDLLGDARWIVFVLSVITSVRLSLIQHRSGYFNIRLVTSSPVSLLQHLFHYFITGPVTLTPFWLLQHEFRHFNTNLVTRKPVSLLQHQFHYFNTSHVTSAPVWLLEHR